MTDKIASYRDLIVWQQAMDLTVAIYQVTTTWPKDEIYGLTGQVRRAATSVPANIAEGTVRNSVREAMMMERRESSHGY